MEMYLILCGVILFLMGIIVFQQLVKSKLIEKLTNKIIAKDFRDYSLSNLELEREKTKRIKPQDKVQSFRV